MKMSIVAALLIGGFVSAQQLPQNLTMAVKETKLDFPSVELNSDLSYYSKNYDKVFRMDNYTFDTFEYGQRNIYRIDFNYQYFDPNTPHIFKVIPLAGVNVDAFMAQPSNAGYIAQ